MSIASSTVILIGDGDVAGIRAVDHRLNHPACISLQSSVASPAQRVVLAFRTPESIEEFAASLLDLRDEAWPERAINEGYDILHFCQPFIPFAEPVPA